MQLFCVFVLCVCFVGFVFVLFLIVCLTCFRVVFCAVILSLLLLRSFCLFVSVVFFVFCIIVSSADRQSGIGSSSPGL